MSEQSVAKDQVATRVQHVYVNGFELTATLSDLGMMTLLDGQPTAKISMSFTTAKSLLASLQQCMDMIEESSGHKMLTMEDVATGYNKWNAARANE